MSEKNILLDRIVVNPKILVGKPIIKGTRLAVEHILDLLAEGMSIDEILQEHTQLTREDILACILFAVAENYGFQPVNENDKNHAVALAKADCSYGGIPRDTTAFKPSSASF